MDHAAGLPCRQRPRLRDQLYTPAAPVPLPAGLPLLGAGIATLGLIKRRRKQA
ncbi:MAG: VPLPA-CTERM sorting domain-containing protein [Cypionkella sp.]